MNVTYKFTTDLQTRGITERIHAMQSDANTRTVEVTLLEGGKAWTPAGATASVAFRNLKDGHKGWYDKLPDGSAACTINGNVVTAILAPAVLSGDGEVQAAIVFQDADLNQLATFGFSILVEKNPAAGAAKANDYYAYSTMEDVSAAVDAMLDSLEDTKAQLGQLVNEVNEAVAQAAQEVGPAIVCEATGEAVAVSDASQRALQGLTIYGKTTQDGTPSPDAPIDLVSAGDGGCIGVSVCGSNLFDESWFLKAADWTESGGVYTGFVSQIRKLTNNGDFPMTFAENTQYKISLSARYVSSAPNARWNIKYTDGTYQNIFFFGNQPTMTYAEGVTHAEKTVQSISMDYGSDTQIEIKEMCVSLVSVSASYKPYNGQTVALSTPNGLPGILVASGGNYTDASGQAWICDEIDLARGVYVQRVCRKELSGNESWTASDGEMATAASVRDAPDIVLCLCSHYRAASRYGTYNSRNTAGYQGISANSARIRIVDNVQFNGDVDALKTWLAEQASSGDPVTVLYVMATPIETALDADTLAAYAALHTNKPNTTVVNDAGAGQKLGYVADTKTYIDHKFTEVTNAIVAMGGTI